MLHVDSTVGIATCSKTETIPSLNTQMLLRHYRLSGYFYNNYRDSKTFTIAHVGVVQLYITTDCTDLFYVASNNFLAADYNC